ncbi:MAG TPA: SMP-30/gluconolactonase/LRE family protein [Bauldia sp.]|nr:SMP-30/gluconolactonase/LRE family protein [Bauldia sp.]
MQAPWTAAIVTPVADGLGWGEGPAFLAAAGGVVFSDVAADTMYLWRSGDGAIRTFRRPSGHANGNTVDHSGRLITCEHRNRRVTRTEADGSVTVIASAYGGRSLNSPNDVIVARDGAIWFTDPPYGILRGECGPDARMEQSGSGVYRVDPKSGEVVLAIDFLDKPNGLAFSPDETRLYVSDTGYSGRPDGNHHIFGFTIAEGRPRTLTAVREITPGACDGLRIDAAGNIWSTAGDGIQCFCADGTLRGRIDLGEMTTNLCFLPAWPALFVTTPSRALAIALAGVTAEDGFCRENQIRP